MKEVEKMNRTNEPTNRPIEYVYICLKCVLLRIFEWHANMLESFAFTHTHTHGRARTHSTRTCRLTRTFICREANAYSQPYFIQSVGFSNVEQRQRPLWPTTDVQRKTKRLSIYAANECVRVSWRMCVCVCVRRICFDRFLFSISFYLFVFRSPSMLCVRALLVRKLVDNILYTIRRTSRPTDASSNIYVYCIRLCVYVYVYTGSRHTARRRVLERYSHVQ